MRVLVIGATGAIGRRVVPALVARGHQVTAVARSAEGRAAVAAMGASPIALDIFDRADARRAADGHEVVVNLATRIPTGMVRPFLPGAWAANSRIRREASAVLAESARDAGVARFVQESFAPVYADGGTRWLDESSPVRLARYNAAVRDAERAASAFTEAGGTGVALRFALFYGAGDPFTRIALDSVRRGMFPLFGRADGYVSMVDQDDAAAAVVAALEVPAGIYNVVDDEPLTRRALADALAGMLGVAPPKLLPPWVARLGGSLGETIARSLRISNGRLRSVSDWRPRYPSAREGWRAALPSFGA